MSSQMGLHAGEGGRITNHLRLGSMPLMCCMYSCLCRGSKHHKLALECFIHCLLSSVGFAVWSCVYVWEGSTLWEKMSQ